MVPAHQNIYNLDKAVAITGDTKKNFSKRFIF